MNSYRYYKDNRFNLIWRKKEKSKQYEYFDNIKNDWIDVTDMEYVRDKLRRISKKDAFVELL